MVHHHVRCASMTFHYPEIITPYEKTANREFVRIIRLCSFVSKSPIVFWEAKKALFLDGTIIYWYECKKDCYVFGLNQAGDVIYNHRLFS